MWYPLLYIIYRYKSATWNASSLFRCAQCGKNSTIRMFGDPGPVPRFWTIVFTWSLVVNCIWSCLSILGIRRYLMQHRALYQVVPWLTYLAMDWKLADTFTKDVSSFCRNPQIAADRACSTTRSHFARTRPTPTAFPPVIFKSRCIFKYMYSTRQSFWGRCHNPNGVCDSTDADMKRIRTSSRELKTDGRNSLNFQKMDIAKMEIRVYTDANFANIKDFSSQLGWCIYALDESVPWQGPV